MIMWNLNLSNFQELKDINDILKQVFLLLPHYCLGRGLIDMAAYQLAADTIGRYGELKIFLPSHVFALSTVCQME